MRKRIVAVLTAMLFVVLCFALAACSGELKHTHTPNADDGDCTTADTCTVCQEVISAKSHVADVKWNKDKISHWKVCANLDCTTVVIAKTKHTIKSGSNACESCDYVDLSIFTITNGNLTNGRSGAYTSITIPDSVTSIGNYAFDGCSGLTSITIPESVTSIGNYAFSNCSGLTSITIPSSVTSISKSAFSNCSGLASIMVAEGNRKFRSVGNNIIETATKTLIVGCKNSSIPTDGSVTSIGDFAFWGCGATSITIPINVISIGDGAFYGCSGLTLYAEASAKPSGWLNDWNDNCPIVWNYKNNDIATDGNIYYVAENGIRYALKDNAAMVARQSDGLIGAIDIPSTITYKNNSYSVKDISNEAFYECRGLTSMTIGNSVTIIGNSTFSKCTRLTRITYKGTRAEWGAITKGSYWNEATGNYTVTCTDGLTKSQS